jgi:hypothetical protein
MDLPAQLNEAHAGGPLTLCFQSILTRLETGDYAAAAEAMRHWAEESDLTSVADEVVERIRICIMDARAELIHLEPGTAEIHIRQALALSAIAPGSLSTS